MLYFVNLESRCRRIERRRYWVRERSVWRIDSLRFRVGLCVLVVVGVEARVSIVSTWFPC